MVPELEAAGHDVVAVDLPCDDDAAGLIEYADVVVGAIGDRQHVVLVAQSLGGFVAPLVCERVPVRMVVLVAAMVPKPGESGAEWWDNSGATQARREMAERYGRNIDGEFDPVAEFLHDVPEVLVAEGWDHVTEIPARRSGRRGRSMRGPDVPTRSCCAVRTASSPPTSNAASYASTLVLPPTRVSGDHLSVAHRGSPLSTAANGSRQAVNGLGDVSVWQ